MAYREKKSKACEEVLQSYLTSHPDDAQVILPLAQLYAQQHKHEAAVEVLAKLPLSSRTQPTTVEAIVSLYNRQKNPEKAVACLREAIQYWSKNEEETDTLGQVLRIAARVAVQIKDRALAAEVYQSFLENIDGSDYEALCGLVQALSVTDPERATEYAERLQVPSFDPENPGPPPDPERWLPKRERSEFKKKMRKRDKHLLRGPQGAITTEDFRKQGPSTAQVEVSKDAAGPSRRSNRKNKGK